SPPRDESRPAVSPAGHPMSPGGEGGIRTRGAFAHRFSRAAPSTTRTPLRGRGYQTGLGRPGSGPSPLGSVSREGREELFGFVSADAADDLDPTRQRWVLRKLDDRPGRPVVRVCDGGDERPRHAPPQWP